MRQRPGASGTERPRRIAPANAGVLSLVVVLLILGLLLVATGCGGEETSSPSTTTAPSVTAPSETEATSPGAGSPVPSSPTPPTPSGDLASVVPAAIAGLPVGQYLSGDPARQQTEQLHGKALGAGLDEAYLAAYGDGEATLWVTRSLRVEDATDLMERMKASIGASETPFTNPQTSVVSDVTVEALDGMGQKHYYFRIGRDLYWLAISPAAAERGLQELVANGLKAAQDE